MQRLVVETKEMRREDFYKRREDMKGKESIGKERGGTERKRKQKGTKVE